MRRYVKSRPSGSHSVLRVWTLVGICLALPCKPALAANPVQTENALPGTNTWILANPAAAREIEGYASLTSVNLGGQISFFVNTNDPTYQVDIYRMGWYAGLGARQVVSGLQFAGIRQTMPTPDPTTGLIECNWISQYTLTVPASWVSGIYLAKLTGSSGKQSYIIFVVRDDNRISNFLFVSSVNTYQAYNNWGGKSLYGFNSNYAQARKVSFNRPYGLGVQALAVSGVGAGHFLTTDAPDPGTAMPAGWEYNTLRWLEQLGYDVTYSTDVDEHERGNLLLQHRGLLIVGHSEYWSMAMRNAVVTARDSGINIAVWSANTLYWQVRFEPSTVNGAADRTMVCYKDYTDPVTGPTQTIQWSQVGLPEDPVIGVRFNAEPLNTDIVITNPSHWIFAGTGLQNGSKLTGLLGYEVDVATTASPANIITLASSAGPSNMTIYTASSGALVFAAGSMQFNWGLDDFNSPAVRPSVLSPAAQQMSRNLLAKFVLPPTLSPPSPTVGAAASVQFTALGTGSGNVTWTMNPSVGTLTSSGLYTAPPTVTTSQNVTITATNIYDPGLTASTTLTLSPAASSFTPIRIDSGSASGYTDSNGTIWAPDSGFTGGSTYTVGNAISNTTSQGLYQSQRYGSITYQFAVPAGTYNVNLKFAELYYTSSGQRVFNVVINGTQVLTNFDVVASAGGGFKAVDKAFSVPVTGGQILIQFQTGPADLPIINAIEITNPSGISVQVSPTSATLQASQNQVFSATVTGTANTAVTWSTSPSGVGTLTVNGNSATYTAPASIASQQTVTVTATSVANGSVTGAAVVTLAPTVVTVQVSPTSATLQGSQSQVITATVTGTGNTAVTWAVSPSGVGTLTVNGNSATYTAPASIASQQTVTVTATSVVNGSSKAAAVVTLVPITVQVSPTSATLLASQSRVFTATVAGTANTAVTWAASPPGVGTLTVNGNSATYTAPASIASPQNITLTATSVANTTVSAAAVVTLSNPSAFTPIRVDVGSSMPYTDPLAQVWSADGGYTGGSLDSVGAAISNTTTQPLYQTQRYGNFTYQFAVPAGTYSVNLKFAELYYATSGQRLFNVVINGTQVLTNFDIVASAGASLKAIDKAFVVPVTGGQIVIQFQTGAADLPAVNAIEITQSSGITVQVSPTSVTLLASQSQVITATVTGSANTAVTWAASPSGIGTLTVNGNSATYTAPASIASQQNITVTATSVADGSTSAAAVVTLSNPSAFTPIHVDAGSLSAYTDPTGVVWTADTGYTGGNTYSVGNAIANTTTQPLYQSQRYGAFSYQFTVPSGTYTVNLKFAELYYTTSGQRLFNVIINGTQVLTNFDIVSSAGGAFKALDKGFSVPVTGGQIVIQFQTGSADLPAINAVEIK
jgi:hypothetical protein